MASCCLWYWWVICLPCVVMLLECCVPAIIFGPCRWCEVLYFFFPKVPAFRTWWISRTEDFILAQVLWSLREIYAQILSSIACTVLPTRSGPGDCEGFCSTEHSVPIPVPHHQMPNIICRNAETKDVHLEDSAVPTCLLHLGGEAARVTWQGHRSEDSSGSVLPECNCNLHLAIVSIYWPDEIFGTIIKPQPLLLICLSTIWAKAPIQWNSWVPRGPSRNLRGLPEQPASNVVPKYILVLLPGVFLSLGSPCLVQADRALHILLKI